MEERQSLYKSLDNAGNLNDMRLKDKWCDVTIKVNNEKEIRAHKLVLAANLKYFEAMLSNDSLQESKGGVVTMESVEGADRVESFISFAYTGEFLITQSTALNSLKLANYLSEDGIKTACIEFLTKHLKAEEACQIYLFADSIDCISLKNVAKSTITRNFEAYSSTADYLGFDCESLLGVLSDVKTQPCNMQQTFFEGIMRWISHDINNRKIHMHNLLGCINLNKLTTEHFMNYLGKLVDHNDECGIIKDLVCCDHTVKTQQNKSKSQEQVLLVVGNIDVELEEELRFQFYDFIKKKWSLLQKIPDTNGKIISKGAVLNNKLYFITENSRTYHLQVFDPMTGRITTLNSPSIILDSMVMCASSQYLYFCGGSKIKSYQQARLNYILRFDPQTNTFGTLTPMEITMFDASAAIFYQGCLHFLGGQKGYCFRSVQKYHPDTKEWMSLPSMCKERSYFGVAVLDEKMYSCGGVHTKSAEVYDPEENNWNLIANMIEARSHFSVIAHDGTLLAIGGDEQITIEVYDPREDQWQVDLEMSIGLKIKFPTVGMISSVCIIDAK